MTQFVYEVPKHLKSALLMHLLRQPTFSMVLVFSRSKHGAERVARQLEDHGVRTATMHSNRSQKQRLRALEAFKSGEVRVLVATDIAARVIDVDGISHVVNLASRGGRRVFALSPAPTQAVEARTCRGTGHLHLVPGSGQALGRPRSLGGTPPPSLGA